MSFVLGVLLSGSASALTDSVDYNRPGTHPEVIIAIANFNFDCFRDTIVGWADDQFHYMPHAIHWGQSPENADSQCVSETPRNNRVRITAITYPGWKHLTGSVSFERMNADSLTDMVLYVHGDASDSNGNGADNGQGDGRNTPVRRDSLRALVLYGQVALDSVREIAIASVAKFQSEPFFAMELAPGVDLRKPQRRDISGAISYELRRTPLDVRRGRDTANHQLAPPIAGVGAPDAPVHVHVYPNPSASAAQVEAEAVPPGTYTIEVVAVNGTISLTQNVTVNASHGLLSSLDVSRLASGYYIVRLHSNARLVGTYPIVVTR